MKEILRAIHKITPIRRIQIKRETTHERGFEPYKTTRVEVLTGLPITNKTPEQNHLLLQKKLATALSKLGKTTQPRLINGGWEHELLLKKGNSKYKLNTKNIVEAGVSGVGISIRKGNKTNHRGESCSTISRTDETAIAAFLKKKH